MLSSKIFVWPCVHFGVGLCISRWRLCWVYNNRVGRSLLIMSDTASVDFARYIQHSRAASGVRSNLKRLFIGFGFWCWCRVCGGGGVRMSLDRRVAHFDIQESDRSDDDDDSGGAGGVSSAAMGRGRSGRAGSKARADDIEKEYLMGGGGERGSGWGGADDEDDAISASEGACSCNNRCGGNEKASRIEGRNILLTVTILSMATAGFLLYSSFAEWNATNRRTICIIGIAIGAVTELCGIVGLIGLCRFSDTDKIPFKAGYWLNLIQLWANAGYFAFLLFLWDGKYDSGTMALAGPASSAVAAAAPGVEGANAAAAAVKAAAAFIELSVVAGAAGSLGMSAAPSQGPSTSARMLQQFNAVVGTQIWFLGLSAGLILFSLLYAYGSLRLRCKKMGKWGTTITAVLLAMCAMATLAFGALAIRYNSSLRDLYVPSRSLSHSLWPSVICELALTSDMI